MPKPRVNPLQTAKPSEIKPAEGVLKDPLSLNPTEKRAFALMSPTIGLSYFGLKNEDDVKLFLKSPAGQSVITEIRAALDLQESQQTELQRQAQEEVLKHHLRIGFIMSLLGGHKASAADEKQREEEIIKANARAIERAKGSQVPPVLSNEDLSSSLLKSIEFYNGQIRIQNELYAKASTQGKKLEKRSAELKDQVVQLTTVFDRHSEELVFLKDLEEQLGFGGRLSALLLSEIRDKITSLGEQLPLDWEITSQFNQAYQLILDRHSLGQGIEAAPQPANVDLLFAVSSVSSAISAFKNTHLTQIAQEQQSLETALEANKAEKTQIKSKIKVLETYRDQAQSAYDKIHTPAHTATMTPLKPVSSNPTAIYREKLQTIKEQGLASGKQMTQGQLLNVFEGKGMENNENAKAAIAYLTTVIPNIRNQPNKPLSPDMMKTIVDHLEGIGIDLDHPSAKSSPSPSPFSG